MLEWCTQHWVLTFFLVAGVIDAVRAISLAMITRNVCKNCQHSKQEISNE